METSKKSQLIQIEIEVTASIEMLWEYWTNPEHIKYWNFASDDWCAPHAQNNLIKGGKFLFRMEAKDGSEGFDFEGIYLNILLHQTIEYQIIDGRNVIVQFKKLAHSYKIIESFEPEKINSIDLQEVGWQAILNNYKKYVESKL